MPKVSTARLYKKIDNINQPIPIARVAKTAQIKPRPHSKLDLRNALSNTQNLRKTLEEGSEEISRKLQVGNSSFKGGGGGFLITKDGRDDSEIQGYDPDHQNSFYFEGELPIEDYK